MPWEFVANTTFLFCTFISKELGISKTWKPYENNGEQNYLECENKINFNVEAYQKSDGRIQNFPNEMALDNPTNEQPKLNYEHLCDF